MQIVGYFIILSDLSSMTDKAAGFREGCKARSDRTRRFRPAWRASLP